MAYNTNSDWFHPLQPQPLVLFRKKYFSFFFMSLWRITAWLSVTSSYHQRAIMSSPWGALPLCSFTNYLLFIYINRCYHLPDTSLFHIFAFFQAPAGDFRAAGSSERGSGAALSPPRQSASPRPGSLTCLTAHLPQEKVKQAQTEARQASQPPGSTI